MYYSRESERLLKNKTVKIFGPPGTGKTTLLLNRLDKLFSRGILPSQIAYLSFTNKAVDEARDRARKRFTDLSDEDIRNFRTIHSFCRQAFKKKPVIDPEVDMVEFAQALNLPKLGFEKHNGMTVWNDWSLRIYDKARNRMIEPFQQYKEEKVKRAVWPKFKLIIESYEEYKKDHRVDFTDMLIEYLEKGERVPLKVLIVDEAQDLTPLQWRLVEKLAVDSEKVYLAGDDDQAIYEWNGADVGFYVEFPGRNKILSKSHRLPLKIHDFSQYIALHIKNRIQKDFKPQKTTGAIFTYNRLVDIPFRKPGTWLILTRTNEIKNEVKHHAKEMGLYFQDTKGSKSFDINKYKAIKLWTKLMNGESIIKEDIGILYTYINDIAYGWRSIESKKWLSIPHDQSLTYEFLNTSCGLEAEKDHWTVAFDRNFADRDKLYFENILEDGRDILNESNIIIDTIHSIKGGEADHVVLYEKSCWPADLKSKVGLERSSEYRVWYVGATRAKQELHLLRSNHEYTFPLCKMFSELKNIRYENDNKK